MRKNHETPLPSVSSKEKRALGNSSRSRTSGYSSFTMRDGTGDMIDKTVIVDEMKEQEFGSHPLARLALWMIQHTGFAFPDSYPDQSSDANAAKKRRPRPTSTSPPMAFLLSFSILRLLMYCAARS